MRSEREFIRLFLILLRVVIGRMGMGMGLRMSRRFLSRMMEVEKAYPG